MTKKPIEAGWQSYLKLVAPKEAGPVQIEETRKAFFSGAAVLFTGILGSLSQGGDIEEADLRMMDDIYTELNEFGVKLDEDVLGKR